MFNNDRLRELRKNKGLTQEELGELVGLRKSTICCYEKGVRQPPNEHILDFMQIFNVTADYLLGVDHLVKTFTSEEVIAMSKEEVEFIEELRKDKMICEILLTNPKRGVKLLKNTFK